MWRTTWSMFRVLNSHFPCPRGAQVFWWTTTWSMFAYVWLWLVYTWISPNLIELWEALVTIGFMPIFVFTTYLVDTRGFDWFSARSNAIVPADDEESCDGGGDDQDDGEHRRMLKQCHSIAYYRGVAMQNMSGAGSAPLPAITAGEVLDMNPANLMDKHVCKVLTELREVSVLESAGEVRVQVLRRHGDLDQTVEVWYTCKSGTAVAGLDYSASTGMLVFGPGVETQEVVVPLIDDDMSEPDVSFTVRLTGARVVGGGEVKVLRPETRVTIVDDDNSGMLVFEMPTWEVRSLGVRGKSVVCSTQSLMLMCMLVLEVPTWEVRLFAVLAVIQSAGLRYDALDLLAPPHRQSTLLYHAGWHEGHVHHTP